MIVKGTTIHVEDELKNNWCCRYRQGIPYAGGGKREENFKAQQIIENLQKNMLPCDTYLKLIQNRGREEGMDKKDCQL